MVSNLRKNIETIGIIISLLIAFLSLSISYQNQERLNENLLISSFGGSKIVYDERFNRLLIQDGFYLLNQSDRSTKITAIYPKIKKQDEGSEITYFGCDVISEHEYPIHIDSGEGVSITIECDASGGELSYAFLKEYMEDKESEDFDYYDFINELYKERRIDYHDNFYGSEFQEYHGASFRISTQSEYDPSGNPAYSFSVHTLTGNRFNSDYYEMHLGVSNYR